MSIGNSWFRADYHLRNIPKIRLFLSYTDTEKLIYALFLTQWTIAVLFYQTTKAVTWKIATPSKLCDSNFNQNNEEWTITAILNSSSSVKKNITMNTTHCFRCKMCVCVSNKLKLNTFWSISISVYKWYLRVHSNKKTAFNIKVLFPAWQPAK